MRRAAALALCLGAIALAIGAGFLGALWPPLDGFSHARLHLAAGAGVVALISAAMRRRRMALAALLCAAVAAAGLAPALRGAAREGRPGDVVAVTVAAANVYRANATPEAAAAAIDALDADIVILVEAGPAYLAESATLRRSHPHVAARARNSQEPQAMVLSRFPILEDRSLPRRPHAPMRISVRIDLGDGAALDVAGLHLGRSVGGVATDDLAMLPIVAARWAPPMVIVGDFNATPWSRSVAAVARITGTEIVGGLRPTWLPATAPDWLRRIVGLPIDNVLVSPEIGVAWARGFAVPGSDHRGILVRLNAPRPVSG